MADCGQIRAECDQLLTKSGNNRQTSELDQNRTGNPTPRPATSSWRARSRASIGVFNFSKCTPEKWKRLMCKMRTSGSRQTSIFLHRRTKNILNPRLQSHHVARPNLPDGLGACAHASCPGGVGKRGTAAPNDGARRRRQPRPWAQSRLVRGTTAAVIARQQDRGRQRRKRRGRRWRGRDPIWPNKDARWFCKLLSGLSC